MSGLNQFTDVISTVGIGLKRGNCTHSSLTSRLKSPMILRKYAPPRFAFTPLMAIAVPRCRLVPFLASQKPQKPHHGPFQSRLALIHTARTQGHCPGCLLRKPLDGTDRRQKRWPLSLPVRFFERQSNSLTRGGAAR